MNATQAGETITTADLTAGTVFTFTKDLTTLGPRWTNRSVGTHFVVGGLSESGYTFSAYNTRTGRWDDIMAETWVFRNIRIIGRLVAEGEVSEEA